MRAANRYDIVATSVDGAAKLISMSAFKAFAVGVFATNFDSELETTMKAIKTLSWIEAGIAWVKLCRKLVRNGFEEISIENKFDFDRTWYRGTSTGSTLNLQCPHLNIETQISKCRAKTWAFWSFYDRDIYRILKMACNRVLNDPMQHRQNQALIKYPETWDDFCIISNRFSRQFSGKWGVGRFCWLKFSESPIFG